MDVVKFLGWRRWRRERHFAAKARSFIRDYGARAEAIALAEAETPGQPHRRALYYRELAVHIHRLATSAVDRA